jgi:anti-sigma regulatory factor (Ser/Thr protein kinase)
VAGMIVVGQMIVRSLKALTRQATDMAQRRLPSAVSTVLSTPPGDDVAVPPLEPVRLETRDEVGDVASALNTVQSAAIDLAVGQAVLRRNIADSFVNLGRRNQNLLSRQIAFITELEHRETDPDNLANLFRLDHLATRMRRNAESLLVLGGVPTTRSHSGPMRITDIVRATLSEVEDYQRVVIRTLQPALVNGSTGADLIHLLAELVDNALMFSHRDRTAEVQGLAHPAGYTLTITDQGMGMRPDDIARANRRLAGTEQFTVAPSRYLGHYVAGHLAARHGIRVRLQEAPTGGIAATVHVPHTALASADAGGNGDGRGDGTEGRGGGDGREAGVGGPAPISGGWLQQAPAPSPGPAGPIVHSPFGAGRPANPEPRTTSDHPPPGSLPAAPAP